MTLLRLLRSFVTRSARPERSPLSGLPLYAFVLGPLLLACVAVGCPCIRGAVNASPGLRWWLLSNYGAERMCPEIMKRGAPLKLSQGGNVIGRFFPNACQHTVDNEQQTVSLRFSGTGFAWTPLAGRISFSADAGIEYGMDFYMAEDAVYVWAKTRRIVHGPDFKVGTIENRVVSWAAQSPIGYVANLFGGQIVSGQLASGFTVIHADDGDEFALGILQPPQRPKKPFEVTSGDRYTFANETTEVRYGQVDFVGPLEVADDGQALFFRFRSEGPPAEVLIVRRGTGDLWREGLQRGAVLGPPPEAPITGFPLTPGIEVKQRLKLPKGQYYAVIDNSPNVGVVTPPWNPMSVVGGNLALVSYTAEVGDEDDDF